MGSHKVAGKGYVFTKNSQMTYIGVIFPSISHTKQLAKFMDKLISQSCGDLQLAVCFPREGEAI